jgi:hypothetical protein
VLVVADDHVVTANDLPEVPNARLFPFQSEMTGGIRSDHEGRANADRRICNADAIGGSTESDLLLHDALPHTRAVASSHLASVCCNYVECFDQIP